MAYTLTDDDDDDDDIKVRNGEDKELNDVYIFLKRSIRDFVWLTDCIQC